MFNLFDNSFDISIVMPSYNQGDYIAEAISSIFDGNKAKIRLIISDGGSTDGTLGVLEQMCVKYKGHISWVSQKDKGPANAINKALARVDTLYCGWLNSDDKYSVGAIDTALCELRKKDLAVVYGNGQHIDRIGNIINDYPTKRPEVGLDGFSEGCFICQPTVFFKASIINEIGGLNEDLKTAFDFEFWLRVFKSHQGNIGYVDKVLAYTRMHHDCITLSMRNTVFIESMKLIHSYFGYAPEHWVITYIDEMFEKYLIEVSPENLLTTIDDFVDVAGEYLSEEGRVRIKNYIESDVRVRAYHKDVFVSVDHDGWAYPVTFVRVSNNDSDYKYIDISCRHVFNKIGALKITLLDADGNMVLSKVRKTGDFSLKVMLPESNESSVNCYSIICDKYYVPSEHTQSDDSRKLSFSIIDYSVH